jgi:AraC family transcriptional regulator
MRSQPHAFQGRFGRAILFDADSPVVEHAHAQCHVLFKIGGADGHYTVQGRPIPFCDDSVVLLNPWVPHSNPRPCGAFPTRILALYLEPCWLADRGSASRSHLGGFVRLAGAITPRMRRLAARVAALMEGVEPSDGRLADALYNLVDEVIAEHCRADAPTSGLSTMVDFRIRRTLTHMREASSKDVRIGALARIAGLSRSRFFELFQASTGMSPRIYLDTLCLDAAVDRLADTDSSIAAISGELGFAVPAHFTRFFRQHTSLTPSAYRRAIQFRHSSDNAGAR